jgi:hypothetical protein
MLSRSHSPLANWGGGGDVWLALGRINKIFPLRKETTKHTQPTCTYNSQILIANASAEYTLSKYHIIYIKNPKINTYSDLFRPESHIFPEPLLRK